MKLCMSLLLSAVAVSSMMSEVPASEGQRSNLDFTYRLIERIVAFEHKNAEMEKKLMVVERKNEELEIIVSDQQKQLDLVYSVPANWTRSATAFTATLSDPYIVPKSGRIIFDKIITNSNHDYNPSDGLFRAPVRGRYFFSVTVRQYGKGFVHPALKKNGNLVAAAVSGDKDNWTGSGSVSVVLDLNINDVVRVDGEINLDTNKKICASGQSLFTGILLFPL